MESSRDIIDKRWLCAGDVLGKNENEGSLLRPLCILGEDLNCLWLWWDPCFLSNMAELLRTLSSLGSWSGPFALESWLALWTAICGCCWLWVAIVKFEGCFKMKRICHSRECLQSWYMWIYNVHVIQTEIRYSVNTFQALEGKWSCVNSPKHHFNSHQCQLTWQFLPLSYFDFRDFTRSRYWIFSRRKHFRLPLQSVFYDWFSTVRDLLDT